MSRPIKELNGFENGYLKVIKCIGRNRNGLATWLCYCKCGNETILSSDHISRKSNSVKSCGCIRLKKGKEHHQFNGVGDISGRWWCDHIKPRNAVEINITKEYAWNIYLKQNKKCALSGIELLIHNDQKINTASIDRIDNSLGYVENNIQWVHKHINRMKGIYSQNYFIEICDKISKHNRVCDI